MVSCHHGSLAGSGSHGLGVMLACKSAFYKPCLWSYRILDQEAGLFEVVQNSCTPKVHVLVTVDPQARISCTCRSGREGFKRTQRGCCVHGATRGYVSSC